MTLDTLKIPQGEFLTKRPLHRVQRIRAAITHWCGDQKITHVLSFVLNSEQQDLGSNLIEDLLFDKSYSRLIFHHFVNQNTLSHKVVQRLLQQHNSYQRLNQKLDINGAPPEHHLLQLEDGRMISLDDLLIL